MSEGNKGLQDLLASLSPSTNRSIKLESSPIDNESSSNVEARQEEGPSMISPVPKRTRSEQSDQSANLLNLLRFNSSSASHLNASPSAGIATGTTQQARVQNIHGRGVSSSDLVASFMGKPTISQSAGNATPASMPDVHANGANPQDYLLQLLNRNTSSQSRVPTQKTVSTVAETYVSSKVSEDIDPTEASLGRAGPAQKDTTRRRSPIRVFGSQASRETTPFEPEVSSKVVSPIKPDTSAIFNYVNPFEQLAAFSPLKGRSGTTTPAKELHSKPELQTSASATPVSKRFKTSLDVNGHGILQSIEDSKNVTPNAQDILSDLDPPTNDKATVAQVLNEVGEQVSRQVEYALAQQQADDDDEELNESVAEAIEKQLQQAAAKVKQELNGDEINVLSTLVSREAAIHIDEVLDEAAAGNVDGHHESADDEESSEKAEEEVDVPVYGLPMRPFVSIDIQGTKISNLSFRESSITDIARLKKEFDQVDRVLAAASNNYIVYALSRPGGFRVIRQEDGVDRQAFKETKDHVFNVAVSNEAHNRKNKTGLETCIATAVSGSVYWVTLRKSGEDLLASPEFDRNSLVFPPVPAHDDNTSGGQLKTRAKKSSRHPDYFAIGRGKAIQIVYPLRAQYPKYVSDTRIVDTAKYFKDFTLKINMGKAGKDFVFSEDDTVIATLDKSGKLRLWDITELVEEVDSKSESLNLELKTAILSFPTASGSSKSWPTSVLFVDKPRAYIKGCAQRYVIVGMKQNHTLQLWDLGLGKAVQEINFPHEKESDAICSITYHHHSGIVVVGHPTRNSVYFIHLSAPKYNLLGLAQSRYIHRLANSDPTLPKPEATAILSGFREYSLASKGQLRSLELLPATADGSVDPERGLFELYVMHSKGVTCLSIRKPDLGWSHDNKVIIERNAEEEGYVVVKELRDLTATQISEPSSVNGESVTPVRIRAQQKVKKSSEATSKLEAQLNSLSNAQTLVQETSQDKVEKRPKKKRPAAHVTEEAPIPPPAPIPPIEQTKVTTIPNRDVPPNRKTKESTEVMQEQSSSANVIKNTELSNNNGLVQQLSTLLKPELQALREQINGDYQSLDEHARFKQAEVLRLVSQQLGDNVEKALSRIIMANITQTVIPSIHQITATTLRNEIPESLSKHLVQTLPSQLKSSLPEAVTKIISNPEVVKFMADQITAKISSQVEKQFNSSLQNTIIPSFQTMILDVAQKKVLESERRINEQVHLVNAQHEETLNKISQLTSLVQAFTETVHSMATSQARFQSEILKSQDNSTKDSTITSAVSSETRSVMPLIIPEPTPEQREIQAIDDAIQGGNYEQGVIIWLQSKYQTEIFDDYFLRYDPTFLQGCSSLVALSVIAALTISLVNNIPQRLHWLAIILEFIDTAVSLIWSADNWYTDLFLGS